MHVCVCVCGYGKYQNPKINRGGGYHCIVNSNETDDLLHVWNPTLQKTLKMAYSQVIYVLLCFLPF